MKTSAENISNSILQSIDIVLQERIKELAFDKTLICTIIDDRDKKNGKYQVTDGSIKFWAYSSVDTYSKDEQVRVSVANGDMTQDKYIIGKYIANNDVKPISFVSPLEKVLDISDNLISETASAAIYGLAANGLDSPTEEPAAAITEHEGVEYLTIAQIDIERDYPHYASLQSNKIYDTLYMQADFKSLLNHDYVTSGTFGLMIDLAIKGEDGSYTKHSVVFDNSKMFGNPYNFALYSRQQAKFDIASLGTITGLRVYFFQANDFYNYKGERVSTKILDNKLVKNLLIQNIIVGFGADLSKHNDNTLKLYSNNSTYYNDDIATTTKELAISWYNKTPEDKYLGFSDGVAGDHFTYDETNYISARKRSNQLRSQLSDNVHNSAEGLELSYEIKLIKPELEIIGNKIQKDLCNALTSFSRKIVDAQITDLDGLIVQIDEAGSKIKKQASEMYDYYFDVLKWASQYNPKPEKVVESTAAPDQIISKPDPQNYTDLLSKQIAILQNNLWREAEDDKVFLPLVADALLADEKKEFRSYYDASIPRLIEIYNEIIKLWDKVLARLNGSDGSFNNEVILNNLPNYKSFDETFDSTQDANKYSLYWYRKDESVLEGDEIMPAGWSVIRQQTPDSEVQDTHYNFGLPNADPDNEGYLLKTPESGQSVITVALDPEKKNETFKVILFYNHERFESNELVFTNTKELINKENLKRANALSIKHGELSKDVYQEYGMSNSLMNIADRYKKRMLSVDFALSDGAVDNLQLVGTQIFWYVPNRATMLTYDLEDIENLSKETIDSDSVNPFINDLPVDDKDPVHSEHYRDGYTCFYKTICKGMRLPDKELAETDPQAYESQLAAVTAALEKDIQFCYRIRDYYVPLFSNNMICCKVIKDDITYEAEISFTFASYGTSGTDYTLVITPAGRQAAVTPDSPLLLDVMLFNGDNEQIAFGSEGCSIESPTGGIDKDDNKIVRYTISASDTRYQGIFEVKVKVPYSKNKDGTAIITAYYPIAWSTNKDYYMEGGSMVVYNNQGVNPSYYKDPYRLFTQVYKDTISTGEWDVHYWDGNRDHTEIVDPEEQKQYQIDFNFLPVMQDNKLIPSNMYIDFTDEQKVWTPYVCCTDWYQPILIIQNKYGLPMLNNWDGSLQIDEKNGTILASMIGAGRKTENNTFEGVLMGDIQKAEGDDGQDEFDYNNKQGLGIYGFNDGAQSFGFNVDGTAFIGKSGRGRILFDGNSGQISSASYQQTMLVDKHAEGADNKPTAESNLLKSIAKAGMMIDLDDGRIDMLGVYSTIDEEVEQYVEDTYGADHKDRPKDSVTPDLVEEDQVNIPKDFDQKGDLINPSMNPEDAKEADWNPQQVHISLDSRARNGKPYFRLTDIRGKDLIYAGDKHLFIKSSNYIASPDFYLRDGFAEPDKDEPNPGYGMKIDLYQGLLDAYNLRITSRTFFVDSRKNAKANLIIKDSYTGKNLIYMGVPSNTSGEYPTDKDKIANQWYFQSGNYKEAVVDEDGTISEEGAGMKIDLGLGLIDAYNFKLTSKNVFIDSTKDAKAVFSVKDNNGKYLVYMGVQPEGQADLSNIWYFQSSNYISQADSTEEAAAAGMRIDLGTGLIDAYNFKLTSKNVLIDSTKDADAIFSVKDHKDKYLVYFGKLDKDNPTENELKNKWYLQSSNYKENEDGMKIDLGLGSIDAWKFKLSSENIIINSNPLNDSDPYIQVKANGLANKARANDSKFIAFEVLKNGTAKFAESWEITSGILQSSTTGGDSITLAAPGVYYPEMNDENTENIEWGDNYVFTVGSQNEDDSGFMFKITSGGHMTSRFATLGDHDYKQGYINISPYESNHVGDAVFCRGFWWGPQSNVPFEQYFYLGTAGLCLSNSSKAELGTHSGYGYCNVSYEGIAFDLFPGTGTGRQQGGLLMKNSGALVLKAPTSGEGSIEGSWVLTKDVLLPAGSLDFSESEERWATIPSQSSIGLCAHLDNIVTKLAINMNLESNVKKLETDLKDLKTTVNKINNWTESEIKDIITDYNYVTSDQVKTIVQDLVKPAALK